MISHDVRYTPDFADEDTTVKKTLYFNLRLSTLQQMINYEAWDKKLKWMSGEFDMENMDHRRKLQEFWDVIIERSYGVRDGDKFVQRPEISQEFMGSAEYDALITDILFTEDSKVASKFIRGLFPKKLVDQIAERRNEAPVSAIEDQVRKLED